MKIYMHKLKLVTVSFEMQVSGGMWTQRQLSAKLYRLVEAPTSLMHILSMDSLVHYTTAPPIPKVRNYLSNE